MQSLAREHWPSLRDELGAERCCSLHASHVTATGYGAIWVDQWPAPRMVAAFTGGNLGLSGDASAVSSKDLADLSHALIADWEHVFIDPGESFAAPLCEGVRGLRLWPRVLYAHQGGVCEQPPHDAEIRLLGPDDDAALGELGNDIDWIGDTHDGAANLAASGRAVGAFVDDGLASVAAVFYVGTSYEELGVVTEAAQRGRGLSSACAAVLVAQIKQRGRTPCWSTTPDNLASQRVADKLGLVRVGEQRHFMLGDPVTGSLPLD